MAKKKRSEKHIHLHDVSEIKQTDKSFSFKDLNFPVLELGLILIITLVAYLPVFKAGFVWDDTYYIQNNQLIRSINLESIFSKYVMGNYHPFTMLAFAIEYKLFGLNETGYHVINLLLHLANVLLVYYAVFLLSKKTNVALIAALLFGIHPLHTESVAWISELKDLLYTSFFLGAYIFYLKYLNEKQNKFYLIALLLFLFSLLSKAMAVSLPVLLLLTDYFKGRKMNLKTWTEKIPFLLLAIIFGIVAILAQQSSEAIKDISIYSLPQRIVFACYGFITYLWKSFLPLYQSAFYPYPIKSGESLSTQFYIYPVLLLGLIAFVIYSLRFTKKIIFGLGFFTITVLLVLQLLPVGDAVMADRYSYIPSIGIFYLAGEGFNWIWINKGKTPAIALLSIFIIFLSIITYSRNTVWNNGITLWTDVIKKFPDDAIGYNNRGGILLNEKKYELALADLNKVIQLRPGYAEALSNRGIILLDKKRTNEALNDLNMAIKSRPDYAEALNNRGLILMELNKYAEALNDFNKAIELRPGYAEAYYNRGLLFMNEKKYEQAVKDYDKALELKPGYPEAIINRGIILNNGADSEKNLADYNNAIKVNPNDPRLYYIRGLVMMSLNKNTEAIDDFNKSIELKPDYANAYLGRGNAFVKEKNPSDASKDFTKAIELDPGLAAAYLGRANIARDENRNDSALVDYNKAIELDPSFANAYYNRGILLIKEKKFENVINDFSKVLELKGDSALSYYNRGMAEIFLNRTDAACRDLQIAADMGLQAAMDSHKQFCK
jgi:tetratricopeptide (TPR) repeat protein